MALLLGGITNPVYSLLIAYTNDFLGKEDMAAASAGLLFMNGLGRDLRARSITGWLMEQTGPRGFFLFIGLLYGGAGALCRLAHDAGARPRRWPSTGAFASGRAHGIAVAVGMVMEAAAQVEARRTDRAGLGRLRQPTCQAGADDKEARNGGRSGGGARLLVGRDRPRGLVCRRSGGRPRRSASGSATLWQAARDGGLDHWAEGTVGSLAFLILTDQFRPQHVPRPPPRPSRPIRWPAPARAQGHWRLAGIWAPPSRSGSSSTCRWNIPRIPPIRP
ncbi:MAG: hypothetical protein MZV49_24970 [Rhodopseudomonas palustris]|nr:hypothetical protein [Rhodopseudomonas palustris]